MVSMKGKYYFLDLWLNFGEKWHPKISEKVIYDYFPSYKFLKTNYQLATALYLCWWNYYV